MKITFWRIAPLFIFFSLALFLWRGLSLEPSKLPAMQLGHPLPNFKLLELNNKINFITSNELKGKTYLLNIWASWCSACIEEQAFLLKLSETNTSIIGINYKDNSANARQWLATWGDPYQFIGEDPKGKLSMDLGVYGAPETFIIDSQGIIRFRHVGILTEEIWQKEFLPVLKLTNFFEKV